MSTEQTKEKDITIMWMRGLANCICYYIESTHGGEPETEADANATIFQQAINITNETGLTPRQLKDQNEDYFNQLDNFQKKYLKDLEENNELKEQRNFLLSQSLEMADKFNQVKEQSGELLKAITEIREASIDGIINQSWWQHFTEELITKYSGKQD